MIGDCPEGGIILDPFVGVDTTGIVALTHNRKYLGIELNPEYAKIAEDRLKAHIKALEEENGSKETN